MARLYIDADRYAQAVPNLLVETVRENVLDLVRRKLDEHGGQWRDFVFGASDRLITKDDFAAIERRILESGYRFSWSATISPRERPDAYKPVKGVDADADDFSFEHDGAVTAEPDSSGREQRGIGENVVRHAQNAVGIARYIRSCEQVTAHILHGVPPETIAIIDDSGGTLTAPIIEYFSGIICAGGTVRSHLGILAREYGIPCLMNARVSGIRNGDKVEIEATAETMTSDAYFKGETRPARVWKLNR